MSYNPRDDPTDAQSVDPAVDGNIESDFGDAKKVTDAMLIRTMRNIKYLKMLGINLQDSTDPELRKRFNPPLIDSINSYGVVLDSGSNTYKLNNSLVGDGGFVDDINNFNYINRGLTTAYVDLAGSQVTLPPSMGASGEVVDIDNACASDHVSTKGLNVIWYIGWKENTPFWLNPKWLTDPFSENVATPPEPSVLRGMTFTAGYNLVGQTIDGITIANGQSILFSKAQIALHGDALAEDDFYAEVRTTSGGLPTQNVIAREKVNLRGVKDVKLVVIKFPHPLKLTVGTKYALVLRGGFTSWDHKYGIAGWQVHCPGTKPLWGSPCVSVDNGRTWKNDIGYTDGTFSGAVPNGEGVVRPREFAMQTYMRTMTTVYPTGTDYWVYWKAFRTNPIQVVQLSTSQVTPTGTSITWQVSTDLQHWHTVSGPSWNHDFSGDTAGEQNQNTVYVRAKLNTTNSSNTPSIQSVNVTLTTATATSGYLRTQFYNPRLSNPMGAAIWSRLHAPVNLDPGCTCLVDIIRNTTYQDRIDADGSTSTFTLTEFPAYPMSSVVSNPTNGNAGTSLFEKQDYTVNYDTKTITFVSPPQAGDIQINYNPIWIKGLTQDNFPQIEPTGFKTDLFDELLNGDGSTETFTLKAIPADPIRHVYVNNVELYEDEDFVVDYLNKQITFNNAPPSGTENIEIKYTPFLADIGLAFAYRITRPDSSKQVAILGNYFQNRV